MTCPQCRSENKAGYRFCANCGASLEIVETAIDEGIRGRQQNTGARRYATGKNPIVSAVLSLFVVGLGQFYNGDMKKGAVMFGGAVIFGFISFGVGWLVLAIWSAIDAYQVGEGKKSLWN